MLLPLFFTNDGGAGGAAGTDATSGGGATPPKPDSGSGAKPPAGTGDGKDDDKLGEGGKAALQREREAREAAETEAKEAKRALEELQAATGSEHERAINTAKREATAEANGRWANHVRTAVVEGALRGAGIVDDKALALAMRHESFGTLKVDPDSGKVTGVTEAVDAFKADYGQLFKSDKPADDNKDKTTTPPPPPASGQWDGGAGGQSGGKKAGSLEEAVMAHYGQS